MNFSYRIYVELRILYEFILEVIANSLRFTPIGPKRFNNLNNIDGKVVIVTGSNTGIGKVTVEVLSKLGAKVRFLNQNSIEYKLLVYFVFID